MGHKDAGVYQAYINQRVQCDVQAAFLGRPSSTALFKAVTHMSRHVDPRAPTDLSPEEIQVLKADSSIVQLRELRDRLSHEAREESGTLKNAETEGTKIYQMYKQADRQLRCEKAKVLISAKKAARQQFFDTISTIEINKQLGLSQLDVSQLDVSLLDLNKDDWEPKKVEHILEERQIVADLICKETYDLTDHDKLRHRIRTANALVALCRKKDIPIPRKPNRSWGVLHQNELPKPPSIPETCKRTQCIFCFWNPREPHEVRLHHFSTVYKTRDHVELHLKQFKKHDGIPCPDPNCQEAAVILTGHMHFKSHAARIHDYDVFRKPSRS
jgi:hypothetical protein